MSVTFEKKDGSKLEILFSVSPEEFEKGINDVFYKVRGRINMPGFRQNKLTRKIVEMRYGKEYFYAEAADDLLNAAYKKALLELPPEYKLVSRPEADVLSISAQEGVKYKVEVYIEPDVTVSEYKGLTYKNEENVITDADVNNELEMLAEKNVRLVTVSQRAAQKGDEVDIDYEGFVDGVPFEGGADENATLSLGSQRFIPGFEEQIEGHETGDEFTIDVKFPDEYHSEDLSGKAAQFKIKLNEIREKVYPVIDDEFAQDVSDFDTLQEYKDSIYNDLKLKAEIKAKQSKEAQLLEALLKNVSVEFPECMIDDAVANKIEDITQSFGSYKLSIEDYAKYIGTTEEEFMKSLRVSAVRDLTARRGLLKVAELENVTVSEDELNQKVSDIFSKSANPEEEVKKFLESEQVRDFIKLDLLAEKGLNAIVSYSIEEEKVEEKEEL
ncbi:MAG: trigger factor [Clostridiales bacterium]|nr:trigger factor [Clostridiales bacterium]